MTHQTHPSVTREVVQVLAEHGFDGMAQAMELLINECMKIERQQALGVGPYQRKGLAVSARRDVRAGSVHRQSDADHRRIVRLRNLVERREPGDRAAGRGAPPVADPPPGLPEVPDPRRPL